MVSTTGARLPHSNVHRPLGCLDEGGMVAAAVFSSARARRAAGLSDRIAAAKPASANFDVSPAWRED